MAAPQSAFIARDKADTIAAILNQAGALLREIDPEGANAAREVAGYFENAATLHVAPRHLDPGPP